MTDINTPVITVITVMEDLAPFLNKEITLKNGNGEKHTGFLVGRGFVGKTRGSIGKAYLKYKKKNGLPGNKGVNIFPKQTIIEIG